ncbi:MAG: (2Fe-2S) ferredoxin domain-containing protein [Cyanobacteria bacterium P01_D01_bin.36]
MNVLQGRYLKRINTRSGKLKGFKIKTEQGMQTVYLPKPLRTIAQQELSLGDLLRVWTMQRYGKDAAKAKTKKKKTSKTLWALQIIPLSPKSTVAELGADGVIAGEQATGEKVIGPKQASSKKIKQKKKKAAKGMTVQLCQKKNCCKRGGTKLWSAFEAASKAEIPFELEAVGCLGGCKRGPNIRFMPDNVKHYHVQPKDVEALLAEHG